MGCGNERTIERSKDRSSGYPVCRFTTELPCEISSLVAINSKKVLLGGKGELLMFDVETKEITPISKDVKDRINCLIQLPDGKVVSGGQDNTIKIWDIEKKSIIATLEGHTSIIWDIKYLGNNKIISGGDDNTSKLWDLNKKTHEEFFKAKKHVSVVCPLKNKKILLAVGNNILLFDLETKKQESFLEVTAWALKELKNGDVVAGLGKGLIYLLKITDEITIKAKFPQGHKKTVGSIIELDDGRLVSMADENDLILWDINDLESMYILKGHNEMVTGLCFVAGNKFVSVSKDQILKIWE